MDNILKRTIHDMTMSAAKIEGEKILLGAAERNTSPAVLELALIMATAATTATNIRFGLPHDRGEHRNSAVKAFADSLDSMMRQDADLPKPGTASSLRAVLDAAANGEKCPGCGDIHEAHSDDIAELREVIDTIEALEQKPVDPKLIN